MTNEAFRIAVYVLLLAILAVTFYPLLKAGNAIRAFVAFYFLLIGLRFMVGSIGQDDNGVFLGALFASLALTFFWVMRKEKL